eukprot:NODE_1710_length_423_cov_16.604730_g1700_i0.p2 GENE.NODE_1710_length_423_cov_16.604730_g1700_i0~~NODE_1710_length_423_cov_16.604730_g1700_i0.p2  ORF type:complete len:63 (-),score=2.06 NODE_1710_length_423_cov_16.604730_g1700_i0:148-336(-)
MHEKGEKKTIPQKFNILLCPTTPNTITMQKRKPCAWWQLGLRFFVVLIPILTNNNKREGTLV